MMTFIGASFQAKRRMVLAGLSGFGLLALPFRVFADSSAGTDPLMQSALELTRPDAVFLVAIALAGARIVAVGEHGVIIYSDDSGASWVQAKVPVNVTLTCVAFADPRHGWAAGGSGAVVHTDDGGKTWSLQLTGTQANQLTTLAAQDPALATSTLPGAPVAMRRASVFTQSGPSKPFLTMWVQDARTVTVFGAFKLTMKTVDGGKNWQDWSLHIYDRKSYDIYDAVQAGNATYLVGEIGLVFCSTDGGNNYKPLTPAGQYTLFGIVVAPDGSLIVFGVSGAGFRSTDSGQSWTPLALVTADDLTAGRVLQSKIVVICSEAGAVYKSTDNGVTFSRIPNLPPMAIADFFEAPNGDLICVGGGGVTKLPAAILNS